MEWIEKALPYIVTILTGLLGWLGGRAMQAANVTKAQADARRTLAEAEKLMAEGDSEVARNMTTIIGAWRTLHEQVRAEMDEIREEQDRARGEHNRVLAELRRYKRGVDVLIKQLRALGVEPKWTPVMDGRMDGSRTTQSS